MVAVVIPVLNEETAIGAVVRGIPRELAADVVVVDGGSRDRTVAVAQAAGARVVVERRRGYGRACGSGAAATKAEIIVFLDGDGSDDAGALARVIEPLLNGGADLVLGTRTQIERGALPLYAQAGNQLASRLITLFWGQRVTDLPSCKAIRRSDLVGLGMTEATYGWTIELIVKAARRRLRIREVPLIYRQRQGGESKVSGNLVASSRAAVAILRVLFRHGLGRADAGQTGRLSLLD